MAVYIEAISGGVLLNLPLDPVFDPSLPVK